MTGLNPGRRINRTDLLAGLAMLVLCGSFVFLAWGYGVGRPARMGPGFYPFAFGLVGMGLALLIILRSLLSEPGEEVRPHWRSLLFIVGGIASFGLLVEPAGVGPAVFVSTTVSALADPKARLPGTLVLAAVLTLGVWLIFVKLLGLPIDMIGGLS